MRILNDSNDGAYVTGFETLTAEVYGCHPGYAANRAAMMARAVDRRNPFFRYGEYTGFLVYDGGRPVAHAAAIVDRRIDSSIGFLGFFESLSNGSYGERVVSEVVSALIERGVQTMRGPVDLNTWNGFRVSFPENEPPFLLEPFTRGYYRCVFADLGFTVAQSNVSTLHARDEVGFDRFKQNLERLRADGFTFCTANLDSLPVLLRDTHSLVLECFSDTWSFIPISLPEFQYGAAHLDQSSDQSLLHVAYSPNGKPVGFCFGALDDTAGRCRAIVKTVAAAPMARRLEVARALLCDFFDAATDREATEFILSTMREDNKQIRALTFGHRTVYRRYEAYELALEESPA